MLPSNFKGQFYRLADNWFPLLKLENYNRPINYLELGCFYGANIISVANTYGKHKESKLYGIDPWINYPEYSEYRDKIADIYKQFIDNIENSGHKDKIIVNRGFSHIEVPKFKDEYFDIIYIDANHEPEYVLEDAVLCFRKLNKGGIMIFDDYGWGGPDMTKRGIDGFLNGYHKRIKKYGTVNTQVIIEKII